MKVRGLLHYGPPGIVYYTNRVLAYFVSNFVAMATRVGRGII